MLSTAEENYIKCIFKKSERTKKAISTNAIAEAMQTKAASVTDMLKRLAEKELINYQKYKGVRLTAGGSHIAKQLVRKHRLWEVFLVEKLDFSWDEVHDIAEELEHISSEKLTVKLEQFLGFPKYDPHGDPIPDEEGNIRYRSKVTLSELQQGQKGKVVGVRDSSADFLQYLDKVKINLGSELTVQELFAFDGSVQVLLHGQEKVLSAQVAKNLFVTITEE